MARGDGLEWGRLRILEPTLVALADEGEPPEVLTLLRGAETVAGLSYCLRQNAIRKSSDDHYARIDLVITDPEWRGYGLGRLVILLGLSDLMTRHGKRLYSISCLAGHKAVEHVLRAEGFSGGTREGYGFTSLSRALGGQDREDLPVRWGQAAADAALAAGYRIRQSGRV